MWKKAMTYLGLGDDEDAYPDYEPEPELDRPEQRRAAPERRPVREPARPPVNPPRERPRPQREEPSDVQVRGTGTVRPLGPDPRASETGVGAVTSRSGPSAPSRGAVVRPLPIPVTAKPLVVTPSSFNAAQEVADNFKGNAPVIMNLQDVDKELSRRLIDFASGLCYGLGGAMEKVANSVYLLTPADVEVSAEDKRRYQG
jgi:cell division inhibitor SepF